MGGLGGFGGADGVKVVVGVAGTIFVGGEEASNVRVGSALIEGEDGGVLAKEAVIGMDLGTMDGGGGCCAAPGLSDACELTAKMFLELCCGVLLDVGGDAVRGVHETEVEGKEERGDAAIGEVCGGGVVNGGLGIWRGFVVFVYVCFTLAYDIWPVIGVGEGEIRGGWGTFLFAGATVSELVGVDVEELEV